MDIFTAINRNDRVAVLDHVEPEANLNVKVGKGMTPLIVAVDKRSIPLVRLLLAARPRVEEVEGFGQAALMPAAGRGA